MASWRAWVFILSVTAVLTGGALIVIGAHLPWWDGWDSPDALGGRDGRITFALGLMSLTLPSLRLVDTSNATRLLVALLGCLSGAVVLALAWSNLNDIRDAQNVMAFVRVVVGSGLYLTLTGGSLVILGSLLGIVSEPQPANLAA